MDVLEETQSGTGGRRAVTKVGSVLCFNVPAKGYGTEKHVFAKVRYTGMASVHNM